jgi:hypothetical protein
MNKCGTNAGYQKHCLEKTIKCQPCKDAHKVVIKKYYSEYSESIKNNRRIKYSLNKELERFKRKEYYSKNSEKEKLRERIYKKNNPHIKRESERRRRAKKFENGFESYKESQVLEIYGGDCHICLKPIDLSAPRQPGLDGWENGLHIDHVLALSRGGPDTLENVRPAHGSCNVKKHANPLSK